MGANLLSIKSNNKRMCLCQLARFSFPDTAGEYWTSGTDAGCDGNFRWCSVDRSFLKDEVQWGNSEPNRKRGDCVVAKIAPDVKENVLSTENCDVKKKFICEVIIAKIELSL